MSKQRNMQKRKKQTPLPAYHNLEKYPVNAYRIGALKTDNDYVGVIEHVASGIMRYSQAHYPTFQLARQAAYDQVQKVSGIVWGE